MKLTSLKPAKTELRPRKKVLFPFYPYKKKHFSTEEKQYSFKNFIKLSVLSLVRLMTNTKNRSEEGKKYRAAMTNSLVGNATQPNIFTICINQMSENVAFW